jgi:hypothetical protein
VGTPHTLGASRCAQPSAWLRELFAILQKKFSVLLQLAHGSVPRACARDDLPACWIRAEMRDMDNGRNAREEI